MSKIEVDDERPTQLIDTHPDLVKSHRLVARDVVCIVRDSLKRQGATDSVEVLDVLIADLGIGEVSIEEYVAASILRYSPDIAIGLPVRHGDPRRRPS